MLTIIHQYFSPSSVASSTCQIAARSSSTSSPPIQIPEIPPFKKRDNQCSTYPYPPNSSSAPSTSVSPPTNVVDIPPFNKQRKSKDFVQSSEQQSSLDSSSIIGHPEHQLTIGSHGAEWTKRLKVAEQSPIHRSTDCIASKDLGTSSDSELLKPAPSWTNVALKTTEQAGTSENFTHYIFFINLLKLFVLFRRQRSICAKGNNRR